MMRFANKTTFLFDLDGTLIDSSSVHERAFKEVIRQYAPECLDRFDYALMKGRRTRDVFLALGIAVDARLDELVSAKQAHYRAAVQQGQVQLCAGAWRVLEGLESFGRRMFVVTGASRASAEQALESCRITRYFEGMVSADEVQHSKPHPQTFWRCLETYGLDKADALVVEDARDSASRAQASGLDVVLVHHSEFDHRMTSFPDLNALATALIAPLE